MICRILCGSVAVVLLTHASANPASAQQSFELGPFVAYYHPIGSFDATAAYSVTLPSRPSDKAGAALGVRGRVWGSGRIGVEFQVAEAWSTLPQVFTPGGPIGPTSVKVLLGSAQGLYRVAVAERLNLLLSGGGGLVRHGGDSYGSYGSPTSIAAVLGCGSDIRLRPRMKALLGLTTYIYYLEVLGSSGTSLQHGFQFDPVFQLGLTWELQ